MDVWRLIAERKIQEAMQEGAFAELSGTGQPLHLDEDPFEDPSLRMAHRLLRNNGFAPAWIEEGKEIDAAVSAWRANSQRSRQKARELNARIAVFNLKTPSAVWHKLPIDVEREI
jgi:hypothetical protein